MSIERYMCPFGKKTKLLKTVDKLNQEVTVFNRDYFLAIQKIAQLGSTNNKLRCNAEVLLRTLHKYQTSELMSVLAGVLDLSRITTSVEPPCKTIPEQKLCVRVSIPELRIIDEKGESYFKPAIRHCALLLADTLTTILTDKLEQMYLQKQGE